MKILNLSIQLVICVTPTGELKNNFSMYPKNLDYFEVSEFLEFLKDEELITLHETKDLFLNVNINETTMELTHMLRNDFGSIELDSMSEFNRVIEKDYYFVNS